MSTPKAPTQLELIGTPHDWRLDHQTREVGRKGVAEARRALQLAGRDAGAGADPAQAA